MFEEYEKIDRWGKIRQEFSENFPWQYCKCQTRADKKEKSLDDGLEPFYHFSIFVSKVLRWNLALLND